jgi:ribosomal protein S18 acetylase RimI-like enzyme
MTITKVSEESWEGILKIQDEAYIDIAPEELDILKSKWESSPETCFVFRLRSMEIKGYLLSHSWGAIEPPKLFEKHNLYPSGSILYLHDLAVSQDSRGLGVGKRLIENLLPVAKLHLFKQVMLVAVQGSESFWVQFGFTEVQDTPVCSSYGVDAKLMSLNLCEL